VTILCFVLAIVFTILTIDYNAPGKCGEAQTVFRWAGSITGGGTFLGTAVLLDYTLNPKGDGMDGTGFMFFFGIAVILMVMPLAAGWCQHSALANSVMTTIPASVGVLSLLVFGGFLGIRACCTPSHQKRMQMTCNASKPKSVTTRKSSQPSKKTVRGNVTGKDEPIQSDVDFRADSVGSSSKISTSEKGKPMHEEEQLKQIRWCNEMQGADLESNSTLRSRNNNFGEMNEAFNAIPKEDNQYVQNESSSVEDSDMSGIFKSTMKNDDSSVSSSSTSSYASTSSMTSSNSTKSSGSAFADFFRYTIETSQGKAEVLNEKQKNQRRLLTHLENEIHAQN